MGDHYRHSASTPEVYEKGEYNSHQHTIDPTIPQTTQHVHGIEYEEGTRLHRGLKARQITMIAIGGAIGTGLIIGTGSALARAGPGSIFISYTFIGFIVFLVMAALGEMAAWLPLSSGFTGYATRFCDPALGFALGWTYWFKYIIIVRNGSI
jgi:amino acid transporter